MRDRSSLRASDAEREQVAGRLRQAATEGRLDHDELEERLRVAFSARTYGELDPLVADLPSVHGTTPPLFGLHPVARSRYLPVKKTNGMAIASLCLGLFWMWGLGSLLALVFGLLARREIDRSAGLQSGRGLAIAGTVLGIVGLIGSAALVALAIISAGTGVGYS